MSYEILKPLTECAALYNVRTKVFGDYSKISCFSRPIFNPNKFELRGKTPFFTRNNTHFDEKNCLYDISNANNLELKDVYFRFLSENNLDDEAKKRAEAQTRDDSERRAQNKVFEIAYANPFTHLITLTLDAKKINRENLDEIYKKLKPWLSNCVSRNQLKYVICPEFHKKNNAVHFHGLVCGNLSFIDSGTVIIPGHKKPVKAGYAARLGLTGKVVYNIENWKYGFSTAIVLDGNTEATATYVSKYITKDTRKIFGRFYLSGGDLVRQVPTSFSNCIYASFFGTEYTIPNAGLSVKYRKDERNISNE